MKKYFLIAILLFSSNVLLAQNVDASLSAKDQAKKQRQNQINQLFMEADGRKVEALSAELINKLDKDPEWAAEKNRRDLIRLAPLYSYLNAKQYEEFKRYSASLGSIEGERIHLVNAGFVRRVTKDGVDLDYAKQLMEREMVWAEGRKATNPYIYAMFGMDYARLLHRMGSREKVMDIANDALSYNMERKDPDIVNSYLVIAKDFMNGNELKLGLEKLVKQGMSTADVFNELKSIYLKEKKSEAGFDQYFAIFNQSQVLEKIEHLRKTMLDEVAPEFSLKDLKGQTVNLKDLRGKTVILDFWATWCGPCKASFPAMQLMVDKYKKDPSVLFLFIDTWEKGEDKREKVEKFIVDSKYNFQVLMDSNDEVVKQYGIKGIPAKFVIDKAGKLRFRATGFSSDAELMNEIDAMITLSK